MNKLKKQKINNLLDYQHFLKKGSLKKKKLKLKNILFENQILYKNRDLNIIELNNFENIYIPSTVVDLKKIYTIDTLYENDFLFNYKLNYNILYNFNKIMFNYIKKKNNNIIKSKVVNGNHKETLIILLGIVFSMKSINLNNLISNKKKFYINKFNKRKFKHKNFFHTFKKIRIKQIIKAYKLRYLNFKIEKNKNKDIFSRVSYLEEITKYLRTKYLRIKNLKKRMLLERNKKKYFKSSFSRKGYEKKNKKNK